MDPIYNILTKLRINELDVRPAYGSMLIKQSLVENSSWCKVFSTDGENFYYNKNNIKKYKASNVTWFFYHSIFHCILGNLEVPNDIDKEVWDICSDIEVYYTLKTLGLGEAPLDIRQKIRQYDELFDNKDASQIYDLIQTNYINSEDLSFVRIDDHLYIKENEIELPDLKDMISGNNEDDEINGSCTSGDKTEDEDEDNTDEDKSESTEDSSDQSGEEDEGDSDPSDESSESDCDCDNPSKKGEESEGDSKKSDSKSDSDGDTSDETSDDSSDSESNQEDNDSDPTGDSQKDNPGKNENLEFKEGNDLEDEKARPVLDENSIRKFNREYKAQLINIGQDEKDKFPGNMLRLVSEYTEPKIDWKSILTNTIQTVFDKDDYNFSKPSKRSYASGRLDVILPSQSYAKTIDICVSIDSSGSITEEIFNDFVTEVRSIIELYNDYKLHIWCIDTQIYNPKEFTPDNIGELDNYPFAGGGGNDFDENWRFMRENDIVPELFVVLSDGEPCGSWGDADYCETIFVIRNEYEEITAPFGTTVQMLPQKN